MSLNAPVSRDWMDSDESAVGTITVEREKGAPASIIVPTYNEVENIEEIIDRCLRAFNGENIEIIIVDDDSPDRTWELVERLYADDDRVRLIRRTTDRGLATAVIRGVQEATHAQCAVIDADLQHPPEILPDLINAFDDGIDIVVGSRHLPGGGIEGWSFSRRLVSRGATEIVRHSLPEARRVSDPLSGFFAVKRHIVEEVQLAPTGYKVLLEILTKCDYDGVAEVPYVFRPRKRGTSKLTTREYVHFLQHVVRLRSARE